MGDGLSAVAFRCDGDARVGAGHVARCIHLAGAFQDGGGDVVFVGSYEGVAAALLSETPFLVRPAEREGAGVPPGCDVAVVDSYDVRAADVADLARRMPVAAILDAGEAPPGAIGIDYHPGAETAIAGLDYAPVDPRYAGARRQRGFERALVAVGGGTAGEELAAAGTAAAAAAGLAVDRPGGAGEVVVGLLEAVLRADVAISAAGVTAYELVCAGVPTGLVPIAENQRRIAAGLGERGLALTGDPPSRLLERLRDSDLRAALAAAGPAAIDGYGAFRARDALTALMVGRSLPRALGYRPATPADSRRQLAWRNDPAARAASRRTAPVSPAEHERWYGSVLGDPARTLLIVAHEGAAVGSVRFDRAGASAEISVIVDPARRSAGIASQAVAEATELYLAAHSDVARVDATVRPDNTASLRAFECAGFVAADAGEGGDAIVLSRARP